MNLTKQQIKQIQHVATKVLSFDINDYTKFETISITTAKNNQETKDALITLKQISEFNNEIKNPKDIWDSFLKLFNKYDANTLGTQTSSLIISIKNSNNNSIPTDLKEFCKTFTLTQHNEPNDSGIHTQSISQTQSSTTINTQPSESNETNYPWLTALTSSLKQLIQNNNQEQNTSINHRINSIIHQSITPSAKEEHYIELTNLVDRYTCSDNQEKINESYTSNNIFPKIINKNNFPPPMFRADKEYCTNYDNLIRDFQTKIWALQLKHIKEKKEKQTESINAKLELIKQFDNNHESRYTTISNESIKKYENNLKNSMEKINKIIADNHKTPNNTDNNTYSTQNNNSTNYEKRNDNISHNYNYNNKYKNKFNNNNYNNKYNNNFNIKYNSKYNNHYNRNYNTNSNYNGNENYNSKYNHNYNGNYNRNYNHNYNDNYNRNNNNNYNSSYNSNYNNNYNSNYNNNYKNNDNNNTIKNNDIYKQNNYNNNSTNNFNKHNNNNYTNQYKPMTQSTLPHNLNNRLDFNTRYQV